jgi:DNA-binding CsgD family transcriptional regulator
MTAAPAQPADIYERAAGLIERLFQSPGQPQAWRRFLGALCGEMSTDAIAILVGQARPDEPAMLLYHGIDLRGVPASALLPIIPQPGEAELRVGSVVAIAPASQSFAQTHPYRSALAKAGLPPGPGFSVVLGRDPQRITGVLLVLARDPRWQPKPEDHALLELMAPYVRSAILAGLRLNERNSDVARLMGLLDALALGVLLLDNRSRVTFANRSAAEILGAAPGRPADEDEAFQQGRDARTAALRAVLRSRAVGPLGAELHPHPEDGRPLQIVSTPLRWPGAAAEIAARFTAAVFLSDPRVAVPDTLEGLDGLYGLTPAEGRLAALLAGGASLAEAAQKLSIRMSTARGVLKSVFAKTGTRRQASLVNLILSAPGLLRRSAPREARPGPTHRT